MGTAKSKTMMIEIIGAFTLVLVLSLVMLGGPSITGFQAVDFVVEDLNIGITNDSSYLFTAKGEKELVLTSIKLSGEVIGDGKAEVYLDNGKGQRLLIYDNVNKLGSGMHSITGMATGSDGNGNEVTEESAEPKKGTHLVIKDLNIVPDFDLLPVQKGDELNSGAFADVCRDTCYLKMMLSNKTKYRLIFLVDKGTQLHIDKLFYTLDI